MTAGNSMPAAAAAFGNNDPSVSPGMVLTSSTATSVSRTKRSTRAKSTHPSTRYARRAAACARHTPVGASRAGQISSAAPGVYLAS
jgi:hypothetical protein